MPYAGPDDSKLPDYIKELSLTKRKKWVSVWNDTYKKCLDVGGDECEESAFRQANGLVLNSKKPVQVISNQTFDFRKDTFQGCEYYVVPMTAMVEGLYHGEYVDAKTLGTHVEAWNGRPLILHHTYDDAGNPIPANDPDLLEKQQIGYVFKAHAESNKLKMEAWINIDMAEKVKKGGQLLNLVKNRETADVSTAYLRDRIEKTGVFENKKYYAQTTNIKPDHVAIILDGKGECSREEGCGLNINEEDNDMTFLVLDPDRLEGKTFVEKLKAGLASLVQNRSCQMDKKRKAILNANMAFSEEELENLCDDKVDAIYDLLQTNEEEVEVEDAKKNETEDEENQDEEPVNNENENSLEGIKQAISDSVSAGLNDAFKEVGGVEGLVKTVKGIETNQKDTKEKLVNKLVSNKATSIPKESLMQLDMSVLRALERDSRPKNFSGVNPVVNINEDEIEFVPYESPSLVEEDK